MELNELFDKINDYVSIFSVYSIDFGASSVFLILNIKV